jgi:exonuclease SbcC
MKIKEVQISNFRAFNDVKSSTFNFLYNKDEISDLISIYAPNGFGKTSFYDAVEWGVTGKIERFDLVGDFDKTRKENKKGGNKNILQHIGTTENGFVKVITEKATFTENITNAEYNHKKEPRNKFFRDVVLSQEMIDNFLKEQTAEERYNKFVESYPKVTKYNNTYKNIGSLLSYILQETKRIEKEKGNRENQQLKIDFDLEFKKFDQINDAIQFLNANQEAIDIINKETFNDTLYDILTSQVKSRLVSLQLELDAKKIRIENIQIARNGEENNNDNNGGVLNYIDNRKK